MAVKLSQYVGANGAAASVNVIASLQAQINALQVSGGIEAVNKFSDIPNPTTLLSGKQYSVVNDSDVTLNRIHTAGGSDVGQPATIIY